MIRRSANFIKLRHVLRRISKLQTSARIGRGMQLYCSRPTLAFLFFFCSYQMYIIFEPFCSSILLSLDLGSFSFCCYQAEAACGGNNFFYISLLYYTSHCRSTLLSSRNNLLLFSLLIFAVVWVNFLSLSIRKRNRNSSRSKSILLLASSIPRPPLAGTSDFRKHHWANTKCSSSGNQTNPRTDEWTDGQMNGRARKKRILFFFLKSFLLKKARMHFFYRRPVLPDSSCVCLFWPDLKQQQYQTYFYFPSSPANRS